DPGLPFLRTHLFADRFHDLDGGRTDGRIHGASPLERVIWAGRARPLAGRIAAELAAPQGEPWRFHAGLLQVWRAKSECVVGTNRPSMPVSGKRCHRKGAA